MKKVLCVAALLAVVVSAPASAISAHYRAQLEKSGCTQFTDGHGCDINKTKAQNQARARHAEKHTSLSQIAKEVEPLTGMHSSKAHEYLLEKDWSICGADEYCKAGYRLRTVIEKSKVVNAQIVGKE